MLQPKDKDWLNVHTSLAYCAESEEFYSRLEKSSFHLTKMVI